MKRAFIAVSLFAIVAFANPKLDSATVKCYVNPENSQSILQTALVGGKMDIASASLFGTLGSKCYRLVGEEFSLKDSDKNPKEEMQKKYSVKGERALSILWDVSKASMAWLNWAAGVKRDPIQNKTYVLCLISDEVTQAIGFLDEPQEVRMQLTLMGFPGGVPKYVPMSQNLCAETSGIMLEPELYQAYFNYRTQMLNLSQIPEEIY